MPGRDFLAVQAVLIIAADRCLVMKKVTSKNDKIFA